jgi:carotenoid cleavage dioxygenase-like enzyme
MLLQQAATKNDLVIDVVDTDVITTTVLMNQAEDIIRNKFNDDDNNDKKYNQKQNQNKQRRIWNALFFPVTEHPDPLVCTKTGHQNGNNNNDKAVVTSTIDKPKQQDNTAAADDIFWDTVSTKLPSNFPPGCWLRIGPNGFQSTDGFLDGDGMIHCVTFPPVYQQQQQLFDHHSLTTTTTTVTAETDSTRQQQQQEKEDTLASDTVTASDIELHHHYYTSTYIATAGRTIEQEYNSKRQQQDRQQHDKQKHNQQQNSNNNNKYYIGSLAGAPRGYPLVKALISNMITFQTLQAQKDTANTALAEHNGCIVALMEQSLPTEISIDTMGRVSTIQALSNLYGSIPNNNDPITGGGTFSAHGRTCPITGERIHVSYSANEPIARIDIFAGNIATTTTTTVKTDTTTTGTAQNNNNNISNNNNNNNNKNKWILKQSINVQLPNGVPVMIHDCAITKNYIIVLDYPLTVRPSRMIFDKFPVQYEPTNGARIGLVRRPSTINNNINNSINQTSNNNNNNSNNNDPIISNDPIWFPVTPGVILHTVNAYEDDNDNNIITFHTLLSKPKTTQSFIQTYATTFLYEYKLNVKTRTVISEQCLNPTVLVDFLVLSKSQNGVRTKSMICGSVSSIPTGLDVSIYICIFMCVFVVLFIYIPST